MKAKGEETASVVSVSGSWVCLLRRKVREKLRLPGVPWLLLELREPTLVGRLPLGQETPRYKTSLYLGEGQRAPG